MPKNNPKSKAPNRENRVLEVASEFLGKVELELKKLTGVSPEEALSDAREYVYGELEALGHQVAEFNREELLLHFEQRFGEPSAIAREYQAQCKPLTPKNGYAPGWRICCTKCGRSAPAADAGLIRIGAKSIHKYVLGHCSDCCSLRWLRVVQDLEKTNLTGKLGMRATPDEMRSGFHLSTKSLLWLSALQPTPLLIVILLIAASSLLLATASGMMQQAKSPKQAALPFESRLPKDWKIEKSIPVSSNQAAAIGKKLGGDISSLTNSTLSIEGTKLQINTMQCPDAKSADAVEAALLKVHRGAAPVFRKGNQLVEFVGADLRLILDAKNRLFVDEARTYIVEFDAAPIDACADDMKVNDFFNLCLELEKDPTNSSALQKLSALKAAFTFGDRLRLSEFGNSATANRYKLSSVSTDEIAGDVRNYRCSKLPTKFDVPYVHVVAQIESQTYVSRPSQAKVSKSSNVHWPVDDPAIVKLSQEITAGCTSDEQRIEAILNWLQPGKNIKYGGDRIGSRYGVQQTLKQRFGRCWDFSDVFITLCRQNSIPCRQVYGWLDSHSGHVWAEVQLYGNMIAYDPTSGLQTTSDYIPFSVSDQGDVPFVYLSSVKVRQK